VAAPEGQPGGSRQPPSLDPEAVRAWNTPEPGRLVGKGHPAGDFLEAWQWELLEEAEGLLRVRCHLPTQVRNPRGQLFGGFTPTYVDLFALFTVRAGRRGAWTEGPPTWLATQSMRVDYLEPIVGPHFVVDSRLEKKRGRTNFVITRFMQDDELAVLAFTTCREVPLDRPLGDA
jgi:acyl-coenzyme A thioesterase PaaI-like protein